MTSSSYINDVAITNIHQQLDPATANYMYMYNSLEFVSYGIDIRVTYNIYGYGTYRARVNSYRTHLVLQSLILRLGLGFSVANSVKSGSRQLSRAFS